MRINKLDEIVEYLFETCRENNIGKIEYLEIDTNDVNLNKEKLLNHLLNEIPELVNFNTEIKINYLPINNFDIKINERDYR